MPLILFIGISNPFHSQQKDTVKVMFPEMKFKLNSSGTHFIKASVVAQTWLRYSDLNPGTLINSTSSNSYADIGIRRLRFSLWTQLTDRLFFYTQFGQNNFNFLSKKNTGAFIHDAVTEFKIAPQIQLGAGLTGWSGLSRYASPAVGSILSTDVPLYQQVTNGISDQFLRKLSVYAKGQIGRLDYRLALTSPMAIQNSLVPIPEISSDANFSLDAPLLQSQGYLFWQFLDKETDILPYTTGTYLGKKKVLNFGAGWIHQKNAMWYLNSNDDTTRTDLLLLGVDVFSDLPIANNGSVITVYLAYNNFNLGPNYLRNVSVMNQGTSTNSSGTINGAGSGVPLIGTGNTIYGQFGYKFKNNLLPQNGTLQPYLSAQYSVFDKLGLPMLLLDAGINWLIHGTHNGKISVNYQSRPVFKIDVNANPESTGRKGILVLQYQISL